jgi:hypothetical protein
MSVNEKSPSPGTPSPGRPREKGIRIFTWPKVIYLYPSAIAALVCTLGMLSIRDKKYDPTTTSPAAVANQPDSTTGGEGGGAAPMSKLQRFTTPQNLFGILFLTVLGFNILVMALDFPRFELVGGILAILFSIFFILWIGTYFQLDLMKPIDYIFSHVYVFANAGFYFTYFVLMVAIFAVIYLTRWLDYWEVFPNEILHHHGPLSDLERFPTMQLKFDKEIPDTLEYFLLGGGRLVLRIPTVERAIVLDNVLFINSKEEALKKLMSRLEVRITTDQDLGE